jgi:hypothetical protein
LRRYTEDGRRVPSESRSPSSKGSKTYADTGTHARQWGFDFMRETNLYNSASEHDASAQIPSRDIKTHAIHIERLSLRRAIDTTECLHARDLGGRDQRRLRSDFQTERTFDCTTMSMTPSPGRATGNCIRSRETIGCIPALSDSQNSSLGDTTGAY